MSISFNDDDNNASDTQSRPQSIVDLSLIRSDLITDATILLNGGRRARVFNVPVLFWKSDEWLGNIRTATMSTETALAAVATIASCATIGNMVFGTITVVVGGTPIVVGFSLALAAAAAAGLVVSAISTTTAVATSGAKRVKQTIDVKNYPCDPNCFHCGETFSMFGRHTCRECIHNVCNRCALFRVTLAEQTFTWLCLQCIEAKCQPKDVAAPTRAMILGTGSYKAISTRKTIYIVTRADGGVLFVTKQWLQAHFPGIFRQISTSESIIDSTLAVLGATETLQHSRQSQYNRAFEQQPYV